MSAQEELRKLLRRSKIATMPELQEQAVGRARISIFRDLKELGYCSSYNHAGKYYTLLEVARFNEEGLWHYEGIGFSRYGTLKETVYRLVTKSEAGYRHEELHERLGVRVHNTLFALVNEQRLQRTGPEKQFLYVSGNKRRAREQLRARESQRRAEQVALTSEVIIAILAEVIREHRICVELGALTERLVKRGVNVSMRQVAQVLEHYGVKKTLVSR